MYNWMQNSAIQRSGPSKREPIFGREKNQDGKKHKFDFGHVTYEVPLISSKGEVNHSCWIQKFEAQKRGLR